MKKNKIVLTGGGSAGHVTPNLAMVPQLKKIGFEICYIGSKKGIEKELIEKAGIKYYGISSGKLRRYFDFKNFTDPFRVVKGIGDALKILRKERPKIVFSKGGFVVVPVVIAAKILGIPVVAHESDITPGLANKIATPFCNKICVTFPEAKKWFKDEKVVVTGTPIREEIFLGDAELGKQLCKFKNDKPVILIMGGSLGAKNINEKIRELLPRISGKYNIVHLCGKGNVDNKLQKYEGYIQFEYVSDELKNIFKLSDIIISRAGANAIFEFLSLNKPNILIPLSKSQSRGDQILNAQSFEKNGFSIVLDDDNLSSENIYEALLKIEKNKDEYLDNMKKSKLKNGLDNVIKVILENSK
ncbi:undecaprenyldiphospho-muramoylpentapeptide beta-N-acetylglucosaminyltransferase [Oceanirhabdus sp. W0125-5]|uniref:undecaprenyldiphospho-muramoylpentapeptide beta-N-acetylglucosaminyltransferase n=1 Tax=Oceanirhabdus sp. W0125-5 TaxID=2999116 RepID=UPI0022F2C6F7|nr:undecaprenyldiphospho-muramoylpentapeptide beta-N-acetylglucosaminyltransferase [Oceanirhabdus sp. W0125-5]WBW95491.1 undecaprenyldiphospho-muramoylpentapeptide beta-N-acetylglucosaminyltransferase [Oceanirhabdus sp. W0125-5]